jgi:Polysaccharide deacetylase
MEKLWGRLAVEPVFVLTADQDWAPEWANQIFLEKVAYWNLPVHVFRTSPSVILDDALRHRKIEQGWHPNFLSGSSHGSTVDEVINYCKRMFPGARTARAHCFAEDSFRMRALAKAGIVADSQNPTPCQGYLFPMIHVSGILRLPVYFEDDVAFDAVTPCLTLEGFRKTLFTPGLKILNFHPTFMACNTPSLAHYSDVRASVFGSAEPADGVRWEGRGTANLFDELVDTILAKGFGFNSFHSVVDELWASAKLAADLYPSGAVVDLQH